MNGPKFSTPMLRLAAALACVMAARYASAGRADYHPAINAADFREGVDHRFFPLPPGTTWLFTETLGKDVSENEVTVMPETKVILGVTCVVVHDVLRAKGGITEDTYDWYAQDKRGNVWYMGEDTREFHAHGKVSTEGSWEAGVDGAQPGIIMPAESSVGKPYRQEYKRGEAEDMGQVVALNETVRVPGGRFTGCVRTREWSLLESGSEKKWYAPGVGFVRAEAADGEVEELVSVRHP